MTVNGSGVLGRLLFFDVDRGLTDSVSIDQPIDIPPIADPPGERESEREISIFLLALLLLFYSVWISLFRIRLSSLGVGCSLWSSGLVQKWSIPSSNCR